MSPRHLRPSAPPRRSVAPLHRGPQATPLGSMSNTLVGGAMPPQAPNAALLIDFDNVTMGIRSDLQGELNNLLSSDIIKGKVAVRRAYADWRRYPQYIVPLTEASIDLIFAPAYGSAKKNATDIRLAIDALELVFTRPEIGTFVLLSGDSDFSSMVIKLKEYGKYVIGVGIRESSSDLLVMNCDEYYSYNALAGLVRTSDEESTRWDAYELVTEAVQRMKRNGDVMRSDRLKQVMQEIDASFDEKNLGMPKFSRFVQEAQSRGLLTVTKLENGQLEIGVPTGTPATIEAAPADAVSSAATSEGDEADERGTAQEREERRGRRGRRGRGRDRDRDDRPRAGAAADASSSAETEDAAPSTSERAQPAAASAAPLGAVARVSAPTATDAPIGAVARVSSPSSAPSAGGAAAPADAAPLGAVGRSSGGRDRGPRDNRGDGRGDRGPARERTDAPRQDSPRAETARAEAPRAETPRAEAPRAASTDAPDTIGLGGEKLTRAEAFDLVQRAVTSLVSGNATTSAGAVRRKSFELLGRDSETLAARMFERILRDAHDADVIDLRRRGDDYEVGRVAEAATIAEQLAKKEAELAQVQKEAAKASGTAGPTGLGTRGRVAGRGGPRGGRPGGPPPELLMVGVVKAASSASTSSTSTPSAPPAVAAAEAAEAASTAPVAAAEAPSAEPTAPKKSGAAKKAAKSASRTSAKAESKTDGKSAKPGAKSAKSAKPAAKAPAKTAARTSAKSSTSTAKAPAKTAAKAPAKSAGKSAAKSPAKKSAAKKAAKKST